MYTKNGYILPLQNIKGFRVYMNQKKETKPISRKNGGRPRKEQKDPVAQYINLRLTEKEANQFKSLHEAETAGRKVSLQEYVKEKVLKPADHDKSQQEARHLGLASLIQLGEIRRLLDTIGNQFIELEVRIKGHKPVEARREAQLAEGEALPENEDLKEQLQRAFYQIKVWLYGLPPEKV
ncbi:hypothetical protein GCM10023189_40550 [Nibrella saemangeumensis]|uniref:Uncharacterized protein n=1 Tax=Nibrella saemangeumensis TaxID=1084526 RepID=A0ABP8NB70_9BACT